MNRRIQRQPDPEDCFQELMFDVISMDAAGSLPIDLTPDLADKCGKFSRSVNLASKMTKYVQSSDELLMMNQ